MRVRVKRIGVGDYYNSYRPDLPVGLGYYDTKYYPDTDEFEVTITAGTSAVRKKVYEPADGRRKDFTIQENNFTLRIDTSTAKIYVDGILQAISIYTILNNYIIHFNIPPQRRAVIEVEAVITGVVWEWKR
jgi:hypothetical protein